MKVGLSDHAGEISEHNSFDWMARCLRDAAFLGEAEPTADKLRDVILVMLERLALIEGTKGAQWDEFLSTTTPRPTKDLMANGRAFVAEALNWLEKDCHHEAAAMDRIAGIRTYTMARDAQNDYLINLAALAEQDERIRTVLGEAARPESIPNCPCVSDPVVEGAPHQPFMAANVTVEVASQELARQFKTSAITNVMCTAGLGKEAILVDADFDATRSVIGLHFYDASRSGVVLGTNIRVDRTDERMSPIFQSLPSLFGPRTDEPLMNKAAKIQMITAIDEIMDAVAKYGDDVPGVGRIRERLSKMAILP